MAVFISDVQTSNAAKCGLQINWAVKNVVNPALKKQYSDSNYVVKQVVGIDTGEVRVARIGIRGGNDLVWIGRAANYAAKLTECRNDYSTWLTETAYKMLADWAKTAPLIVVRFNASTLWHIDAAEWAPSTTSKATYAAHAKIYRCPLRPESDSPS